MTINAYEIASNYARLFAEYDSEWTTEERKAEIEEELDLLEITKEDKIKAYACRIKNLQLTESAYFDALISLKLKKQAIENDLERMHLRLKLLVPEGQSWEHGIHKIFYWPGEKVVIAEGTVLPPQFERVVPEKREPHKVLIKEVLHQPGGFVADGVSLEKTYTIKVK